MTDTDFRARSYELWERMAAGWDRDRQWMWELSRPVGEWMVEALDPQPGQTILELAAGAGDTGFLAAARVGDDGRLISTDFAPGMVESARAESERLGLRNVEHRQLDAEEMDLPDRSVDGVLCRWGYMLLGDPEAAFRETKRVLSEGGAVAFSVFAAPEANPWASVPGRLLVEVTGGPPPDPTAPGIVAMGDPERTRFLLGAAGLEVKRMEDVPMTWSFDDFEGYWSYLTELAGALAVRIAALDADQEQALRSRLEEAVEPYRSESGYAIPGLTQNTLAA
ncbi:MAG TPA: methyltransferase domain-containing protein [Gaiellaceae bacterium]